jgi:hypothetical protein
VVDDPGAHLVELLAVDHMQDRLVAHPQPIAGELEIRPGADLEAQELAVEFLGYFEIVAQHREVVHALNAHAAFLPCKSNPSEARQSPAAPGLISL